MPRSSVAVPGGGITIVPGYYGGYYPWGFGGLGFYGGYYGGYYGPGYYDPGYGAPYYPPYSDRGSEDVGGLRLKIKPSDATVYVDGYYVGIVDDFNGMFQKLTIEPGPHRIEVRAPGYEVLVFEIRVEPGQTTTYHGELKKLPN